MGSTGWAPPHCPNPKCTYFNALTPGWTFKKKGFYRRGCDGERVQRFTCLACNRNFSRQTFRVDYWLKRPELLRWIFWLARGCMADRQIAQALGCSHSTVSLQIARLARHCLLFQARELAHIPTLKEIAIDGFETFEWSQYHPFHHNLAVDVETGYFLAHTDSELRRKGRMRPAQKARRSVLERRLGRPHPRAIETGTRDLLQMLPLGETVIIRSDDHRDYPRAFRHLDCTIDHRITSSRTRRTPSNPLFEINLLDMMLRHGTAAHKRETIAFVKRRQSSAARLFINQLWRNNIKKRRENGRHVTPAMQMGLHERPLRITDVLSDRLFVETVSLAPRWEQYYRGEVITRALAVNRTHDLKYAF